jgi:hypothetical protein
MRDAYKRRPNDFKRRILIRIHTNRKDLFENEYQWLQLIKKEELRVRYYNIVNHLYHENLDNFVYSRKNKTWSPETREKISASLRGKKHTLERRKNQSEAAKKRKPITEETREKLRKRKNHLGHKHTEETKKIIGRKSGLARLGKSRGKCKNLSEETKENMRLARLKKWADPEYREMMMNARMKKEIQNG